MQRATASNITDIQLDDLYDRLELAAELAEDGCCTSEERADRIRRLCSGEITPQQARDEDANE